MDGTRFRDRAEAGRFLASRLENYANRNDVLVLALPRGGVPVGYEIASALGVPLDVFVVRKLGTPGREELAMGAIAHGGAVVVNKAVIHAFGIPDTAIETVVRRESEEVARRERLYRGSRAYPDVRGRTVILVDDGLATGASVRAAIAALRDMGVGRLIVAVPVGAPITCQELESVADEVVCARTPEHFSAVGQFYDDFRQTTDDEVRGLLERAFGDRRVHAGAN